MTMTHLLIAMGVTILFSAYMAWRGEWREIFEEFRFTIAFVCGWIVVMIFILSAKGII